ncbi:DNA polymerase III subunit delta' [Lysobacter sp. TY2-98]|uniref:DNA polymerase III subunit delta' n=1 Tax=Lysobacter sp. TY2-98 TaxID=2290922 RepID=UPI000E204207|nr:DNA polymerase III subunit delta' [Lysobacter sp. TY2-98]AXK72312.1 DNA polymerase III subunit delta' [Lysobacter sp. TY2-98]
MSAIAPWQSRAYEQIAATLESGRLGHAQLFCGPAQLGKRDVAIRLARRVLCEAPNGIDACGTCRSCRLFEAGTHPDYRFISFIPNREGTKLRTEIVIDQMRELSSQLALTPQYGRAQVAIVDPADAINTSAANALLKTLEEPVPGRYLWLVSAHPARLPATIRSRCQRIEFRLPPIGEARTWLLAQGHAAKDVDEALLAARGHPGLADDWLRSGGLDLRRRVASDLQKLARGEATPQETAQQWGADEHAALRLRHAADLAVERARGLTHPHAARSLATWFDKANRSRDLLRTTVRADLVLMELLTAWRAASRVGQEIRDR